MEGEEITKEIIQESNPELKDLRLFCPTPMHIMKFHTTLKNSKMLCRKKKIGHIQRIQNENGNIMISDFSLAALEGRKS